MERKVLSAAAVPTLASVEQEIQQQEDDLESSRRVKERAAVLERGRRLLTTELSIAECLVGASCFVPFVLLVLFGVFWLAADDDEQTEAMTLFFIVLGSGTLSLCCSSLLYIWAERDVKRKRALLTQKEQECRRATTIATMNGVATLNEAQASTQDERRESAQKTKDWWKTKDWCKTKDWWCGVDS